MSVKAWLGNSLHQIVGLLQRSISLIVRVMIWLITLPYYRFYYVNTVAPIERLALLRSDPHQVRDLCARLSRWRTEKLAELHFISIASAVLAAAVIGSFSWTWIPNTYWLATALWYCCLVLSIFDILLSAQQIAVLNALGPVPTMDIAGSDTLERAIQRYSPLLLTKIGSNNRRNNSDLVRWRPKRKMTFMWQCPIMFLSYAVCLFLGGLTLVVVTPFIRGDPWGPDSYVAVIYISLSGLTAAAFVFCSFWIYHLVDLDSVEMLITTEKSPQAYTTPFS